MLDLLNGQEERGFVETASQESAGVKERRSERRGQGRRERGNLRPNSLTRGKQAASRPSLSLSLNLICVFVLCCQINFCSNICLRYTGN